MYRIFLSLSFVFFLFIHFSFSQNGKLSGVVKDGEYNDILPFANVIVKGTDIGTTTDFEGGYELSLSGGTYEVVFSFVGYQDVVITDVMIAENEVTRINATLLPEAAQLDEVVITASQAQNTEASLINIQKKSVNLMDGISAQGLVKTGASNAAAAVKSIPGVSVQGGKYIYVRGLGDRYTKTILNGVDIPGLDPDRNTIQMDIFPTSILDNIQVIKSATADVTADFSGGVVNIVTKDFPVKSQKSFSLSTGFNPDMHLINFFPSGDVSSTDFLGFDDGLRKLPLDRNIETPYPSSPNREDIPGIAKSFNQNMAVQTTYSPANFGLSFGIGNQFHFKNSNKLGYQVALAYKNETKLYKDYTTGIFEKDRYDLSVTKLQPNKSSLGDMGQRNVLLSGLAGATYKTENAKYKLSLLHIQNGEATAGYYIKNTRLDNAQTNYIDNLLYTQRSISNALVSGTHSMKDGDLKLVWKTSPTLSIIKDKDFRITPFEYHDDTDSFSIGSTNPPRRIWRDLIEINFSNHIDVLKKHELFSKPSKLKIGGSYVYKDRDFKIDQYNIVTHGGGSAAYNADANAILLPENIWNTVSNAGSYIEGGNQTANNYLANQHIGAVYASEEVKYNDKFKSIFGLRLENYAVFYTGRDISGGLYYNNENIINALDVFPSLNLIYTPWEEKNIRLSYARTTARPSFKEASIAQIFDPITDTYFIGNTDIKPSYVNNLDLRFESFGVDAQMMAISGFYKYFKDPIELSIYDAANTDNLTPKNVTNGQVFGLELELRKKLDFIGLKHLSVNLNASYIESIQKMDKSAGGEYESRVLNARTGETVNDVRQLQGQSPYIINAGLSYANDLKGWQSNLTYNVQGKTLQVVGIGIIPDIYTMPFHSLNFNLSKYLDPNKKSNIKLKVSNLLDEARMSVFQSYNAEDRVFSSKQLGRTFSLSYSYKF